MPTEPILAAFIRDRAAINRLVQVVLSTPYHVAETDSWDSTRIVLERPNIAALVVEPPRGDAAYLEDGGNTIRRSPHVPLIAYGRFDCWTGAEMVDLFDRLNPVTAVTRGVDDGPIHFRRSLEQAVSVGTRRYIIAALSTTRESADLLEAAYSLASRSATVDAFAASMACSPRTLRRRCRELDLPPPAAVLRYCRLMRAAMQLARPHSSARRVATRLGFRTARSLRAALRRAGFSIRRVRAQGPELLLSKWSRLRAG